jgi:hypothetical protein
MAWGRTLEAEGHHLAVAVEDDGNPLGNLGEGRDQHQACREVGMNFST